MGKNYIDSINVTLSIQSNSYYIAARHLNESIEIFLIVKLFKPLVQNNEPVIVGYKDSAISNSPIQFIQFIRCLETCSPKII